MSLEDWSKFALDHLNGLAGRPSQLTAQSYNYLHAPPFSGDYMGGWWTRRRDWSAGQGFMHTGSNLRNYAEIWIVPKRDAAVIAATNEWAIGSSDKAVHKAINAFAEAFL